MATFTDAKTGAAITVKVITRAKKTEVVGLMDDGTLRIRVAALPEAGAANRALIDFLAQSLDIPASQVDIMAGHASERKLITLVGISPADVEARLTDRARAAAGKPKPGKSASGKKKKATKKTKATNRKNR